MALKIADVDDMYLRLDAARRRARSTKLPDQAWAETPLEAARRRALATARRLAASDDRLCTADQLLAADPDVPHPDLDGVTACDGCPAYECDVCPANPYPPHFG